MAPLLLYFSYHVSSLTFYIYLFVHLSPASKMKTAQDLGLVFLQWDSTDTFNDAHEYMAPTPPADIAPSVDWEALRTEGIS